MILPSSRASRVRGFWVVCVWGALSTGCAEPSAPGFVGAVDAMDARSTVDIQTAVAPTADTSTVDAVAPVDSAAPDVPLSCIGSGCVGAPCAENTDCDSGFCAWHLGQKICVDPCQDDCPDGFRCAQVSGSGTDLTYVCLSRFPSLCLPCSADAQCTLSLSEMGGMCLPQRDDAAGRRGRFCTGACDADHPCPTGYRCDAGLCRPSSGECDCSASAVAAALSTECQRANSFGVCFGERRCVAVGGPDGSGLTECDAAIPEEDVCDGVDNDCDGDTDEVDCDDADPCTIDTCQGEAGCLSEPATGLVCDDGDACTASDQCDAGSCLGTPVVCDDGDPCTADACIPETGCVAVETGLCACDVDSDCSAPADLCDGVRRCVSTAALPFPHCELEPGSAVVCSAIVGPDAACLSVGCVPETGQCETSAVADGAACDLGTACSVDDSCLAGVCIVGEVSDCDDNNPCTVDGCDDELGCLHTAAELPCDDGQACTTGDTCIGDQCVSAPRDCDDNDVCTVDSCSEAALGCVHNEAAVGCADGNPCTDDSCDALAGCVFAPNAAPCADGLACTTGDHCAGGVCVTAPLDCDDNDVCTADSCSEAAGGCVHTPVDLGCDDGNECTTDSCDPATGCVFANNSAPCSDGLACTAGDVCQAGECAASPRDCDDNDPCTTDACLEAAGGCVQTPGALVCDDGNPCTDDECVPGVGCSFVPNVSDCNDSDPCTLVDQCEGGQCLGSGAPDCDDGNPCTLDDCAPVSGCTHTPDPQVACVSWTVDLAGSLVWPAEAADGTLYFGRRAPSNSSQSVFFALTPDGQQLWTQPQKCIASSLALSGDRLLYTTDWNCSGDGYRLALATSNGATLWSKSGGCGGPHARGAIAVDMAGDFFWGAGSVCHTSAATGSTMWTRAISGYIGTAGTTILSDGSVIGHGYGGGCSPRTIAHISASGASLWSSSPAGTALGQVAIGPTGTLIQPRAQACDSGVTPAMHGISPADGAVLWTASSPTSAPFGPALVDNDGRWYAATADTVVAGDNGTVAWTRSVASGHLAFLAAPDQVAVVSEADVLLLSRQTGAVIATLQTGVSDALQGAIATVDGGILAWSGAGVVVRLASAQATLDAAQAWPKPYHDRANHNRAQ